VVFPAFGQEGQVECFVGGVGARVGGDEGGQRPRVEVFLVPPREILLEGAEIDLHFYLYNYWVGNSLGEDSRKVKDDVGIYGRIMSKLLEELND
jgi:hypothetical protein